VLVDDAGFSGMARSSSTRAAGPVTGRLPADSTKNPPSKATRFRSFAVFVWVEMAVSSHLARCTTAAAAEAEIATAGRTRERRDPRRSPGRRKGFEAERRRSAGAPIPGTSSEARSEVTETTRERKARGLRRSNACGGGSPVGGGADAIACWSGPARRLPWKTGPASEGGEDRHEHNILGGQHVAPRVPVRKDGYRSRATSRAGRSGAGLLAPRLDRRTGSWRAVREGMGSPRYPASRSLSQPPTRVHLRSPAQDPCREIRESLPARLIVTASTIGPMREHMSLNLIDSSPITIAVPTSPRDAQSQASLASRHPGLLLPRPWTVGPARRAERRRVQSVNQSANHSGAQSGAHS
jgi:hypothetical protein